MLLTRHHYVVLLLLSHSAVGVLHPQLVNPVITSCGVNGPWACAANVRYYSEGTVLTDKVPVIPPTSHGGLTLVATTIHCDWGSAPLGWPFKACYWYPLGDAHSPSVTNCTLRSTSSWELTPESSCSLTVNRWSHYGADTGGECVVFVQKGSYPYGGGDVPVTTIMGLHTATGLANSGNAYCQKPLPPGVTCDIEIPQTIDHGVVGPTSRSVVSVEGTVSCGAHPVVTILGGGRTTLSPGVTSDVTTSTSGPGSDRLLITSTLVTNKGTPGPHEGAIIVVASPY